MDSTFVILLGTIPWVLFIAYLFVVMNSDLPERQKTRNFFVVTFIFMALRYGIGYDYYTYKSIIEGRTDDYMLEEMNIIPRIIALSFGKIHYQLFFVVTSFIIIYPLYRVIDRLSCFPSLSFLFFLLYPSFFLDGLSIIRNAMAFSLVVVMSYFLWQKHYYRSILFFLLAVGCHTSSLFAIFIYPVYFLIKDRKLSVILYAVSFALSLIILPLISLIVGDNALLHRALYYIEHVDVYKGGGLMSILINMIGLFNLIYWKEISDYSDLNKKLLPLVNIGVCIWNVFISISPVFATRLSGYFMYMLIFLIPSYPMVFENRLRIINERTISLACTVLFAFIFVMQYVNYVNSGIHMSNLPYQFFFLHTDDFVVNDYGL